MYHTDLAQVMSRQMSSGVHPCSVEPRCHTLPVSVDTDRFRDVWVLLTVLTRVHHAKVSWVIKYDMKRRVMSAEKEEPVLENSIGGFTKMMRIGGLKNSAK